MRPLSADRLLDAHTRVEALVHQHGGASQVTAHVGAALAARVRCARGGLRERDHD